MPAAQVPRTIGSDSYKDKIIASLRRQKLIDTFYRDKLRGYRLTARAREILINAGPERFSFYLTGVTETNRLKCEITRRLRLHSIAEIIVTMQNACVTIFRDEKPCLFTPPGHTSSVYSGSITAPAFYTSREIKEYGADFIKVRGGRLTGVLFTTDKFFMVYNTGNSIMRWEYKAEIRTKAAIQTVICRELLPRQYKRGDVRALMFGADMETAEQLLTSTGGKKRAFFMLDGSYSDFLFLTSDIYGEIILKLLCAPEKENKLRDLLSQGLSPRNVRFRIENDAIDENGAPVLFAYDFNMPRIARFNSGLQIDGITGSIICFDFQADILRRYCCENAVIQTINFNKFKEMFFK
jgi:hypothetical protein